MVKSMRFETLVCLIVTMSSPTMALAVPHTELAARSAILAGYDKSNDAGVKLDVSYHIDTQGYVLTNKLQH